MKFNKNRIAKLAGLSQVKHTLNERKRRQAILRESRRRSSISKGAEDMYGTSFNQSPGDSDDFYVSSTLDSTVYDDSDLADYMLGAIDMDLPDSDMGSSYQSNLRRKMFPEDPNTMTIPASDAMAFSDEVDFMGMDSFDDEENYVEDLPFDPEDDPAFGYDEDDMKDLDLFESEKDKKEKEDVIEIDDKELKQEVRNIRRKRINEARLKAVIEDELREILAEMKYKSKFKR